MEISSADVDTRAPPPFEVGFQKAAFSPHCVQQLIYRSWPWLRFCATAILENNGRKAQNLRGTESALFPFILLSFSGHISLLASNSSAFFPSPTGAINWCLSTPRSGNRADFNWTHGDSCFLPHGVGWGVEVEGWQRKPLLPGDPVVTRWPPHGGIKA